MKNILIVAPHPDDETLGCGGTILKLKHDGYKIFWLIATKISTENGFPSEIVEERNDEIVRVKEAYGVDSVIQLGIPTTQVDKIATGELIARLAGIFNEIKPDTLFLPYYNDVHTDHKLIAQACLSCSKWFRCPTIKSVLFYETLSETDQNINIVEKPFIPNVYINISDYLDKKIEIMKIYSSELSDFPFPRSEVAIKSSAFLRGSQSGYYASEAFELLRLVID